MARGLPAGTVTFLFTDVADSTRLWDEAPSRWPQLLRGLLDDRRRIVGRR